MTNKKFIGEAIQAGLRSPDSTKVGAVIVKDDVIRIISHNDFPDAIKWTADRAAEDTKLKYTIHAEKNAIATAARYGISTKGATMIVSGKSVCNMCALAIIQAGIETVLMPPLDDKPGKWSESCRNGLQLLTEAGIGVIISDDLKGTKEGLNDGSKWFE